LVNFLEYFILLLGIAGLGPLVRCFFANRRTSLRDALVWALAAWLAWVLHLFAWYHTGNSAFRFWALGLTCCSIVAVLGARRPHVAAWNLVVLGLLVVLSLPTLQHWFLGIGGLDLILSLLLPATLLIGVLNYLPTRLATVALVIGVACGAETVLLLMPDWRAPEWLTHFGLLILLCPWLGLLAWGRGPRGRNELDEMWLRFRDRYGLLWGQRVREQFNNAAGNAGWPVVLLWRGLRLEKGEATTEMTRTLKALLKRFEADHEAEASAQSGTLLT
jgi:hypothetical protein